MVSTALSEAAAGRYVVIGFQCEPAHGSQDTMRLAASLLNGSADERDFDLPVLLVLYDTDRCSDKQIETVLTLVHQQARISEHRISAAVLLASTNFLSRLARPMLRAWLARRLLVARVRFHELSADEIAAFLHYQLLSGEADGIFTDEAIAAIANVSGGDPVIINRFAHRMLDWTAERAGNGLDDANLGSGMMISPDVPLDERDLTALADRLRQSDLREPGPQLSTRIWAHKGLRLKLRTGITAGFACAAVFASAVALIHSDVRGIGPRTAPAIGVPVQPAEYAPSPGGAPHPASPSVEKSADIGDNAAATMMAAAAELTLKERPAVKTATPLSVAALRPAPQPATPKEAPETAVNAARIGGLPPKVAPAAPAVVPMGTQPPRAEPSTPKKSYDKLRLSPVVIAVLLSRGDALFEQGEIYSARRFYERAAVAGDGRAALRLANTFDPAFLEFAHLRMRGDAAMAESWYRRARELGQTEAAMLLVPAPRHDQNEGAAAQDEIAPAER